jgi:hypothetical protein
MERKVARSSAGVVATVREGGSTLWDAKGMEVSTVSGSVESETARAASVSGATRGAAVGLRRRRIAAAMVG